MFLNLFGCKQQFFTVFFRKEPPFYYYYYLPHNWSWFATTRSSPPAAPPEGGTWTCVLSRDTGSMRQNSFSQKSYTNILKQKILNLVCNDTILTSGGSARGGYLEVRSAARHKQHAAEQPFNNRLNPSFIFLTNTGVG